MMLTYDDRRAAPAGCMVPLAAFTACQLSTRPDLCEREGRCLRYQPKTGRRGWRGLVTITQPDQSEGTE